MNFKKSNFLFFTLLMLISFFFTKNALADSQISWYICPVVGLNKVYSCENSKIDSGCYAPLTTKDACLSNIASMGGTVQAISQTQTVIDAQLKADQEELIKQSKELAKKAAYLASLMCDCSKKGGECRDDFTSEQDATDYCNSCGIEFASQSENGCPLGSKEIGPFHCSCGTGSKAFCSTYDTYSELKSNCAKTCGSGNGSCPVDTSALSNLKKNALILNPAAFAFGSAGVTEIVGKMIIFLMFPIGMFAMIMYIWAGFLWMTAQGNSENVSKAKTIIVWTTLGIVATMASYIIVQLIFTQLL